jgi:hypothetical protein
LYGRPKNQNKRIINFTLEIPLAHCVRGGMVRRVRGKKGKKRAADESARFTEAFTAAALLFPISRPEPGTIPPPTVGGGGISYV